MDRNTKFDIIVIGAGPSGLAAAEKILSLNQNLKIALIESGLQKEKIICCGEGVYKKPFEKAIKPKPEWIKFVVPYLQLLSPNGQKITYKEHNNLGFIIDRKKMQTDLLEKCLNSDIDIYLDVKVVSISAINDQYRRDVFMDNSTKLSAKVVIDASGPSNNITYDDLKVPVSNDTEVGYLAHIKTKNVFTDTIQLHIGSLIAPGGYAWVFPRSHNTSNVGIVLGKPFLKSFNIKKLLHNFISLHYNDAQILDTVAGTIPCYCDKSIIGAPGVLRCGDAAHLVNPIRRTGISEALLSGSYAGEFAVKICISDSEKKAMKIVNSYKQLINKEFCKGFNTLAKVKYSINKISDDILNKTVEKLTPLPLEKITMLKIFTQAISQNPRLIFALKHFL